jgi:hypothetical protein
MIKPDIVGRYDENLSMHDLTSKVAIVLFQCIEVKSPRLACLCEEAR